MPNIKIEIAEIAETTISEVVGNLLRHAVTQGTPIQIGVEIRHAVTQGTPIQIGVEIGLYPYTPRDIGVDCLPPLSGSTEHPKPRIQTDKSIDAFTAEIDALLAEDDTHEIPDENHIPKAIPTG